MRPVAGPRSPTAGDAARVATAAVLLVAVRAALVGPFGRVRRALLRAARHGRRVVPGTPAAARVARAVAVADRYVPGGRTCLVRSLTAETLLRLYGHDPAHRIGVDRDADGGVRAHSWLEDGDRVLIGDVDSLPEYDPLPPLDGGERP